MANQRLELPLRAPSRRSEAQSGRPGRWVTEPPAEEKRVYCAAVCCFVNAGYRVDIWLLVADSQSGNIWHLRSGA